MMTIQNQLLVVFAMVFCGLIMGMLNDLSRVLLNRHRVAGVLIAIMDTIFWGLMTLLVIGVLMISNWGEMRVYVFGALLIGVTVYYLTMSPSVMSGYSKLFNLIEKFLVGVLEVFKKLSKKITKNIL